VLREIAIVSSFESLN